jgi:hypothetical protein
MMMRLASAAAIAALMSTAAMAQTSAPAPTQPSHPPMAQPVPAPSTSPSAQRTEPMAKPATSAKVMTSVPSDTMTVTNYYKQAVYDPSDNKIGEVEDLLVQKDGKLGAAVIGVGGFLGIGEKDVIVPFEALKLTQKNNKWYLVMNATKDELKSAPGFKYDRTKMSWIPEETSTTGMGDRAPASPGPANRVPADRAPTAR